MKKRPKKLFTKNFGKKSQLDDAKHTIYVQSKCIGFFKLGGGEKGRFKATDTGNSSFLLSGVKKRLKYVLKADGTCYPWQVLPDHSHERPLFSSAAAFLLPALGALVQADLKFSHNICK